MFVEKSKVEVKSLNRSGYYNIFKTIILVLLDVGSENTCFWTKSFVVTCLSFLYNFVHCCHKFLITPVFRFVNFSYLQKYFMVLENDTCIYLSEVITCYFNFLEKCTSIVFFFSRNISLNLSSGIQMLMVFFIA